MIARPALSIGFDTVAWALQTEAKDYISRDFLPSRVTFGTKGTGTRVSERRRSLDLNSARKARIHRSPRIVKRTKWKVSPIFDRGSQSPSAARSSHTCDQSAHNKTHLTNMPRVDYPGKACGRRVSGEICAHSMSSAEHHSSQTHHPP